MTSLSIMQRGTSDAACQQTSRKKKTPILHAAVNTLSQRTAGPCAHSSVSDPGRVTAAAQKDQRSSSEHTGLAGRSWGKAVNDSSGRIPFGNHWRWRRAAAAPGEGKGGVAGRKDWSKHPWGRRVSSCHIPLLNVIPKDSGAGCTPGQAGTGTAPCPRWPLRASPVPRPPVPPARHTPPPSAAWGQRGKGACVGPWSRPPMFHYGSLVPECWWSSCPSLGSTGR